MYKSDRRRKDSEERKPHNLSAGSRAGQQQQELSEASAAIQTSNAEQNKRRNTRERDNGYSLRDQIEPLKKAFLLALVLKQKENSF